MKKNPTNINDIINSQSISSVVTGAFLGAGGVIILYYLAIYCTFGSWPNAGIFGDTAGFLSSFFACASFILLVCTFLLQKVELEKTNELVKAQKEEMQENQKIQEKMLLLNFYNIMEQKLNDSIKAFEVYKKKNKDMGEYFEGLGKGSIKYDDIRRCYYKEIDGEYTPIEIESYLIDEGVKEYKDKLRKYGEDINWSNTLAAFKNNIYADLVDWNNRISSNSPEARP